MLTNQTMTYTTKTHIHYLINMVCLDAEKADNSVLISECLLPLCQNATDDLATKMAAYQRPERSSKYHI